MSKLHIGTSPTTGTIFAWKVLKSGILSKDEQDVTQAALVAVSKHVLHFGEPVVISKGDGTPEFKITVERL